MIQEFYADAPLSSSAALASAIRLVLTPQVRGLRTFDPPVPTVWEITGADSVQLEQTGLLRFYYSGVGEDLIVQIHVAYNRVESLHDIADNLGIWNALHTLLAWNAPMVDAAAVVLRMGFIAYARQLWSQTVSYTPGTWGGALANVHASSFYPEGGTVFDYSGDSRFSEFPGLPNEPWRPLEISAAVKSVPTRYQATYRDSSSPFRVQFWAADDTTAAALADAIAAQSGARWTELGRLAAVDVAAMVTAGTLTSSRYKLTAASTSDVQRKARATWSSTVSNAAIVVDIPSISSDAIGPGADESTVEPVDSGTRALLRTPGGAGALAFRRLVKRKTPRR